MSHLFSPHFHDAKNEVETSESGVCMFMTSSWSPALVYLPVWPLPMVVSSPSCPLTFLPHRSSPSPSPSWLKQKTLVLYSSLLTLIVSPHAQEKVLHLRSKNTSKTLMFSTGLWQSLVLLLSCEPIHLRDFREPKLDCVIVSEVPPGLSAHGPRLPRSRLLLQHTRWSLL